MSVIIQAIEQHDPGKPALVGDAGVYCYGELSAEIRRRAEQLAEVSVLGLALDNGVDWVAWDLAALKSGIPCVPLPPFFTPEQIAHAIHTAGITHILSPEGLRLTGQSGGKALPQGTAKVTFTSGTTGAPKGVCLPGAAMENVATGIVSLLGKEFTGIHACTLPLAVLLENVAGVYAGLVAGGTIHLASLHAIGADYGHVWEHLKKARATSVILVPEILRILMAQVAVAGPLPILKFVAVGGSRVDPSLILQARQMGLPVYEGYGLSECASVMSLNTPAADRPGTVGRLLPHVRAEISGGEIRIERPGFLGYVGEPAPDPFYTGDLGEFDGDGFLSVTGRKKNLLITSYGRNVSPEWVEAALLMQPAIAQAVVYGDAKPHLSALIVPSSPSADVERAVGTANQGLPDYAQIKDFQTVPPFTPANGQLTGTGRPRRDAILSHYAELAP